MELYNLRDKLFMVDKDSLNEEATKFYFVVPFLIYLGYDMFNPIDVAPEYSPSFYKTNERVDFALFIDEIPRVFVEVKKISDGLNEKNINWLAKYFNVEPSVKLAILTNGESFWFFSDFIYKNIMDKNPFYEFNISSFNDIDLYLLDYFYKSNFNSQSVINCMGSIQHINKFSKGFNYLYSNGKIKGLIDKESDDFYISLYELIGIDEDYLPKVLAEKIIPLDRLRTLI